MFSLIHRLETVQWLGWNISSFPGDFCLRQPSTVVTTDEWQQVLGLGKNGEFFVSWMLEIFCLKRCLLKNSGKNRCFCCWGQDAFVCRLKRKAGVPRLVGLWSCWMSSEIGFLARYLQISEMCNKNPLVSTCFNSSRKRGPTYFWLTELCLSGRNFKLNMVRACMHLHYLYSRLPTIPEPLTLTCACLSKHLNIKSKVIERWTSINFWHEHQISGTVSKIACQK